MYSLSSWIRVLDVLRTKPTPSSSATDLMLSCEDCSRYGSVGLSALMSLQRLMPASITSVARSSPLWRMKPTSEMTPSMLVLYFW